jgi:periplasmic protein TonB
MAQAGSAGAEETVYAIAEKMPQFPGGQTAFRSYLMKNFEFPEAALGADVTGPVQIGFVVTKKGAIRGAQVVKGQHPALDQEALRLITAMPAWIPGEQHGEAVNVFFSMPIRFTMPPASSSK